MKRAKGKYVAAGDINIKYSGNKVKSKWSFWAGLSLSLISLILILIIPCPTDPQLMMFRFVMAIGLASLASSFGGFFQIKKPEFEIGSGLLIFVLIFFAFPIMVGDMGCKEFNYIHGQVLSNNSPVEGAMVMLPIHETYSITNVQGNFNLRCLSENLKAPFQIQLKYQALDTLIFLEEFNPREDLKLYIKP